MKRWAPIIAALVRAPAAASPALGPYLTDPRPDGMTVRFETARPVSAEVRYATGAEPERIARSRTGTAHAVVLRDLRPATRYRYRVVLEGEPPGADLGFRTAPPPGEPFSFVVMGDTRSAEADHRAVLAQLAGEAPDLVLHTGDLVEDGAEEAGWKSFFDVEGPLLSRAPLLAAMGNHEAQNQLGMQNFTRFFGIALQDGEMIHALTYGNTRFLVMDTNLIFFSLSGQTAWLERELQAAVTDPSIRHIFVMMHHGPYATGPHGGSRGVRAAWAPLFAAYGVEAVFSGHDHLYERLEQDGVRYFVSGGGGGPLYQKQTEPDPEDARASLYTESVHHYVRVHVAGEHVELAALRAEGSLIESVRWRLAERTVRPPPLQARAVALRADVSGHARWIAVGAAMVGIGLAVAIVGRRRRISAARQRGT